MFEFTHPPRECEHFHLHSFQQQTKTMSVLTVTAHFQHVLPSPSECSSFAFKENSFLNVSYTERNLLMTNVNKINNNLQLYLWFTTMCHFNSQHFFLSFLLSSLVVEYDVIATWYFVTLLFTLHLLPCSHNANRTNSYHTTSGTFNSKDYSIRS
jgi:hypothetical protein